MEERLEELIEEIESEKKSRKAQVVRSDINQPTLLAINSANATNQGSVNGFTEFSVDMPRAIISADTIQLVHGNFPQCVQNIPDRACVFWYYRLNAYSGQLPSPNNLHWVRLLPSYYKKELIVQPEDYGYNQTFHTYQDVADQLELSCKNDLANDYWKDDELGLQRFYDSRFIPYDISITYNSATNKFEMNGLNVFNAPAFLEWNNTTNYYKGQKVYFLDPTNSFNISWTCIQDNINEQPNTSPDFWIEDNEPIVEAWDNTYTYQPYRVVEYNGILYQALLKEGLDGNPIVPQPPNINHQPDTSTTWWEVLPEGLWFSNRIYNQDVVISYDDKAYKSLQANNVGNQPDTSPLWWEEVETTAGLFAWNRYLIAGYNDPNVALLQGRCYKPYDDTTLFEIDDVVFYNNSVYKANKQTLGAGIPSADWDIQSTPITTITPNFEFVYIKCDTSLFAGVSVDDPIFIYNTTDDFANTLPTQSYTIFETIYKFVSASGGLLTLKDDNFDEETNGTIGTGGFVSLVPIRDIGLRDFSGQFDYTTNAVEGVPPQPYALQPKRLLNSILGFTWTGEFTREQFYDPFGFYSMNEPYVIDTTNTDLFNRLRPLQKYLTTFQQAGLRVKQLSDVPVDVTFYTGTYTADGYCNLVYTSILNVYASIVYGSTLDTQKNANLLEMVTMNCSNLGISFFNPVLNMPLNISGSDIYNIQFSFTDEFGDPYYFTNNAVVSMVLKLTYKKDGDKI